MQRMMEVNGSVVGAEASSNVVINGELLRADFADHDVFERDITLF